MIQEQWNWDDHGVCMRSMITGLLLSITSRLPLRQSRSQTRQIVWKRDYPLGCYPYSVTAEEAVQPLVVHLSCYLQLVPK